jgi:hypothetical protein
MFRSSRSVLLCFVFAVLAGSGCSGGRGGELAPSGFEGFGIDGYFEAITGTYGRSSPPAGLAARGDATDGLTP